MVVLSTVPRPTTLAQGSSTVAMVTVPRPLQEQLGEAATESLVGMFEQLEASWDQQHETQKERLFELLEERFLRHVAESEGRLRVEIAESEGRLRVEIAESEARLRVEIAESENRLRGEIHAEFSRQQEQIVVLGKEIGLVRSDLSAQLGAVHADVNKQIAGVHKQIADVHKQIAGQTKWILTVLGGAAVLFPIIQRLMAALVP